jgi:selenocysteine lyase/cysteine desulfurase
MIHGSRRSFLQAVSIPGPWAGFAAQLRAADSGESHWNLIRSQFPLEDGLLYFNAANVCPASRLVLDRHAAFLRDFHGNPSFQNRDKYVPMQERTRAKLARLLNVAPGELAITRNTSEASNAVITGMDLKAGSEVIITEHNHPSNNEAWKVRAARWQYAVKSLPVPVPAPSAAALMEELERTITPRTRVIAITHVTNTAGLRYPVKAIGELARRRGVWFHLDGAQSLGALEVDLRAIGCDSYSGSFHKWPMGPLESGLLYVKAERQAELWPSVVTAGWSDKLEGARKYEVLGQRDDPRIAAIEAAVDFLAMMGSGAEREARLRVLTDRLKQGFGALPGATLRTNLEAELSGGVVKVDFPAANLQALYDNLWTRHRVSIALTAAGPTRGLRFSPHLYNTLADVDHAVAAVGEELKKLNG